MQCITEATSYDERDVLSFLFFVTFDVQDGGVELPL